MAWACCKKGPYKDSKEVTGRQTRKIREEGIPTRRWMDYVGSDPKNMGIKIRRARALDRTK
jgi:hypothetical protein